MSRTILEEVGCFITSNLPETELSSQYTWRLAAWSYLYLELSLKSELAERRTQRLQRGNFQMIWLAPQII